MIKEGGIDVTQGYIGSLYLWHPFTSTPKKSLKYYHSVFIKLNENNSLCDILTWMMIYSEPHCKSNWGLELQSDVCNKIDLLCGLYAYYTLDFYPGCDPVIPDI